MSVKDQKVEFLTNEIDALKKSLDDKKKNYDMLMESFSKLENEKGGLNAEEEETFKRMHSKEIEDMTAK